MQWLSSVLAAFWQWWRHDFISVKQATAYILLLSALFFLLGNHRSPAQYRQLENELAETKQEIRLFAAEIARRNGLLNNARARDNISKKTIDLLSGRIDNLEYENINLQERSAFYQHVLTQKSADSDLIIYALNADPDFAQQRTVLSAIFARPGTRKKFNGSYYFEIAETDEAGSPVITRFPAEGSTAFTMNFYHEIEETVALPPEKTIDNLRVVVLDAKGNSVASVDLEGDSDAALPQDALNNDS